MLHIRRKYLLLKKGLHHFFEIGFPLRAMWLGFVFMFIPGMQMGKLMHSSYQECINIQIVINGDAVAFSGMWWAIIAKLAVPVSGNLKLTLKVIYPTGYQRCSRRWKIPL